MSQMVRLSHLWESLLNAMGVERSSARPLFADLTTRYTAPERHYHNLDHIAHCLETAATLQHVAHDYWAIQLAIWFHDVIYDTRAHDNEAQSAAYAAQALQAIGVSPTRIETVEKLILATEHHSAAASDMDAHILLDADLAILGSDVECYRRYARAIRREYGWVPDAAYRAGRVQVLTRFLQRERIYFTGQLHDSLEESARQNIAAELKQLQAAG